MIHPRLCGARIRLARRAKDEKPRGTIGLRPERPSILLQPHAARVGHPRHTGGPPFAGAFADLCMSLGLLCAAHVGYSLPCYSNANGCCWPCWTLSAIRRKEKEAVMGEKDSTVTRVWPVFDSLFHKDPTGETWLSKLLSLGSIQNEAVRREIENPGCLLAELARFGRALPGPLKKLLGPGRAATLEPIRNAFEIEIPPVKEFLRWLLEHPEAMQWPVERGGGERIFSGEMQSNREALLAGNQAVQANALQELERGGTANAQRAWWAFEGFASVDCLLETDKLLVLIEGIRTEAVPSSTDWFPQRNKVVRYLESARNRAAGKKNYAVLVCAEKAIRISDAMWKESLPHLAETERAEVQAHFLGFVTWGRIASELCDNMNLPEDIGAAVQLCMKFRVRPSTDAHSNETETHFD